MDISASFKQFDIRGDYPTQVDERFAYALAMALAKWKKLSRVLVCCDTRESSPTLKEYLIAGFSNCGIGIGDLGEAPMPVFNFAMTDRHYDLGVMVTASHVADTENGFKIILTGPLPLDEHQLEEIKNIMAQFQSEPIVVPKLNITKVSVTDKYIAEVLDRAGFNKPKIKLALDATRSAVLTTIMIIMQKLRADFHFVSNTHSGNPLLGLTRKALVKDVIETKSDLGIIWDSDGDRVVFVDRHGNLIPLPFTLGVLATQALKNSFTKNGRIAVDIRAGLVVRDLVTQSGGELTVLPAWNQYIKFAMRQDPTIVFGGETSGHFIFPDFHCIDDGILASLRFIRLFEEGYIEEKLDQLAHKYYELPEQNFPCDMTKSPQILEAMTEHYRQEGNLVSVVDGLTVFGPNFKFNLRESATENLLRLNLEAPDEKTAQIILQKVVHLLNA